MLIDRYVFRELAVPTLLGLLVYSTIFLVQQTFRLAEEWTHGVLSFEEVLRALTYLAPSVLAQTIPMSVLLGVLIGFSRLSADSEITALRAAGVSYYRLLLPTLLLASVAWGAAAAVYIRAVPWANQEFLDLKSRAARRADFNREISPGAWVKLDNARVHARGVDNSDPSEPWLLDVDIVLTEPGDPQREHLRASRARINRVVGAEDGLRLQLVLHDVDHLRWDDSKRQAVRFSDASMDREVEQPGARLARIAPRRIFKGPRQQSLDELRTMLVDLDEMDRIDALAATKPKAAAAAKSELAARSRWVLPSLRDKVRAHAVLELHKKFSIPLACLVFALAGMPLGIATRRGGRPASFVVSIGVILLWWIVYSASEAWMETGKLSPVATAWLPDVALLLVGVHLHVRLRKQQALGLYRWLRHGALLAAGVLFLLGAALQFPPASRGEAPVPPRWPLAAGLSCVAFYLLLGTFRDPVARGLTRMAEAFRRPRQRYRSSDRRPSPRPKDALAGADAVAPASPGGRSRLERLRGALILGLLAIVAAAVFQVFEHEDGIRAGLFEVSMSWLGPTAIAFVVACALLQRSGLRVVKTVDAWILTSYLKALGAIVGSLVLIYVVLLYLEIAGDVLEHGAPFAKVADFYAHMMPRILFEMTPFGAMMAALVVFGVMTKFNETTALRCGGISVFRLVAPILLMGLLLSGLFFVIHDYVLPQSNRRADELKDEIRGRAPVPRAGGKGFVFARDNRSLYLYERFLLPDPRLPAGTHPRIIGLTVLGAGPDGRMNELISAQTATWNDDVWTLERGWRTEFVDEETVVESEFDELLLGRMEPPRYFAVERVEPSEMTWAELKRYIEDQETAGYPTARARVTLQRKIAFPATSLVLVLIGLPFAFTTGRHGALYGVGVAIIVAAAYWVALQAFAALGDAGYLAPAVAAWAPNGLFALAGVFLMLNVRT